MERAYALIEVKSLSDGSRTFSGWATTPTPDRVKDTINPLGARFANPVVLLSKHDHTMPIGHATLKKPTAKGIPFEAAIPSIEEPAALKERVDVAWGEVKHKLVRAVSIGFRPLKHSYRDDGGIDFEEIEILELSTVPVPANAEATITHVKAIDAELLAASGRKQEGQSNSDQGDHEPAAPGKTARVVKLVDPARARAGAKPYVIKRIIRL